MNKTINNLELLQDYGQWSTGLRAGLHTLFKSDLAARRTAYRLFIDEFDESSVDLHIILNELLNAGPNDTLELRISSPGGIVNYGIGLINVIKTHFHNRTITVIDSLAASMAALVFVEGTERLIHPDSALMFHEVSFAVAGKASDLANIVKFEQKQGSEMLYRRLTPYFTEDELKDMVDGKTYWLNAIDMCERGLATGVIVKDSVILNPEDYILYLEHPEYLVETEDGSYDFIVEEPKTKKKASKRKPKSKSKEG